MPSRENSKSTAGGGGNRSVATLGTQVGMNIGMYRPMRVPEWLHGVDQRNAVHQYAALGIAVTSGACFEAGDPKTPPGGCRLYEYQSCMVREEVTLACVRMNTLVSE